MNSFYGEINFRKAGDYVLKNGLTINGHHFSDEMFDLTINRDINNDDQIKSIGFDRDVLFGLTGEIFNGNDLKKSRDTKLDIDLVAELYHSEGLGAFDHLDGSFTIFVIDYSAKKMFIVQDRHTSLEHVFYYADHQKIYLASDIKKILKSTSLTPEVNMEALPSFLYHAWIPGNDTLFKNVYKLAANTGFEYDMASGAYRLFYHQPQPKHFVFQDKMEKYIEIIDQSLKTRVAEAGNKQIGMLISGGFDSNLLLTRVKNFGGPHKMKLFSVGTPNPRSEIHSVRKNIAEYQNQGYPVEFIEHTIGLNEIQRLPKIIHAYGNLLAEQGIILHSVLADLIKANEVDIVLCGEGPDQMMRGTERFEMIAALYGGEATHHYRFGGLEGVYIPKDEFKLDTKRFTEAELKFLFKKEFRGLKLSLSIEDFDTSFMNYFNLKKSQLKYYGMTPRYPYVNPYYEDYIDQHFTLNELRGKNLHKEIARKYVPEKVRENLKKIGGSTEAYLLFLDNHIRAKVFQIIRENDAVNTYFEENVIQVLLTSLDKAMVAGSRDGNFSTAEYLSNRLLLLLSFGVWHKLFISSPDFAKMDELNLTLFELFGLD